VCGGEGKLCPDIPKKGNPTPSMCGREREVLVLIINFWRLLLLVLKVTMCARLGRDVRGI
jgi:hypothetical protein